MTACYGTRWKFRRRMVVVGNLAPAANRAALTRVANPRQIDSRLHERQTRRSGTRADAAVRRHIDAAAADLLQLEVPQAHRLQ